MTTPQDNPGSLQGYFRKNGPRGTNNDTAWLYRKLASVRTSIYLLFITVFFYVAGTVFPQGEKLDEYAKAGGKYILMVKAFGLLDLFTTPLFIFSALAVLANLLVCVYDRYPLLYGAKRSYPKDFTPDKRFYLTYPAAQAHEKVRFALKDTLGFKLVDKDSEWIIMEKGLPYKKLNWLYHAGIIVLFAGFLLTFLFSFEGTITLYPGVPQTLVPTTTGRLQRLWKKNQAESKFSLLLEDFTAEYVQSPHLDYPKDAASRIAIGLGWKAPSYELKEDSLAAKDWTSTVKVIKDNRTVAEQAVKVNEPLRYGGYTFYQEGYEQKLRFRVDDGPILLETKAGDELMIPGLESPLKFGELKTGTLTRLDGSTEKIIPYTTVKMAVYPAAGKKKFEDVGRVELGGTIDVAGKRVTFAQFDEGAQLSYRYDPGVGILWAGWIFVVALLFIRFYPGYYMAAYRIEESGGIVFVELSITAKGLLADREKLIKRVEYHLTKDDVRIDELPSVPPVK